jgi:dinuclear metal center YbgI/SA1388 family protein
MLEQAAEIGCPRSAIISRQPPKESRSMNVQKVINALETIAPIRLAAEWDNVGLLIGSPDANVGPIMLTIDLTDEVLREAKEHGVSMIVAYHPPIFQPLSRITDATMTEQNVLEAARSGIAVYSPHTALDAAPGGVNDWLVAGVGGADGDDGRSLRGDVRAIDAFHALPESEQCKIVTFCPEHAVDAIRNGLATIGAGRIGEYQLCSFEMRGTGTFFGSDSASPAVGEKGRFERVEEVRLEMVCSESSQGLAVMTLREFHPYEEPPIEIYKLQPRPDRTIGQGRRVVLDQKATLEEIVDRIKKRLGVARIRAAIGRDAPEAYRTIGVCAGAGASIVDAAISQGCELFFTGEMRHHDVLRAQARGCTVVLAGHTNTERGYLAVLQSRMKQLLPDAAIVVSSKDRDPLLPM